jgi:hypothetical protein
MHDASRMRCGQRRSDLDAYIQYFLDGEGFAQQVLAQRLTFDEFRGDEQVLFRPNLVDGQNVRVVQTRCGKGLTFEALQSIFVGGEIRMQDFDGDSPGQIEVVGEVDLAHATRTQRGANLVATKGVGQ